MFTINATRSCGNRAVLQAAAYRGTKPSSSSSTSTALTPSKRSSSSSLSGDCPPKKSIAQQLSSCPNDSYLQFLISESTTALSIDESRAWASMSASSLDM